MELVKPTPAKKKAAPKKVLSPQAKAIKAQRNGLIQKVHLAKRDLRLDDETYRDILATQFRVKSSTALGVKELEKLVKYFQDSGWKVKPSKKPAKPRTDNQVARMRARVEAITKRLGWTPDRLDALVKSKFALESFAWAQDAGQLKQLLAILGTYARKEAANG